MAAANFSEHFLEMLRDVLEDKYDLIDTEMVIKMLPLLMEFNNGHTCQYDQFCECCEAEYGVWL